MARSQAPRHIRKPLLSSLRQRRSAKRGESRGPTGNPVDADRLYAAVETHHRKRCHATPSSTPFLHPPQRSANASADSRESPRSNGLAIVFKDAIEIVAHVVYWQRLLSPIGRYLEKVRTCTTLRHARHAPLVARLGAAGCCRRARLRLSRKITQPYKLPRGTVRGTWSAAVTARLQAPATLRPL